VLGGLGGDSDGDRSRVDGDHRGGSLDGVGRVLGSGGGGRNRSVLRVSWDRLLGGSVAVLGDGGSGSGERKGGNGVTHFG
jgi:hypothetical protein